MILFNSCKSCRGRPSEGSHLPVCVVDNRVCLMIITPPLYPSFRYVIWLTFGNLIKSYASKTWVTIPHPQPHTRNCILSCTNRTAILATYFLLLLLVLPDKHIIITAYSESGQLFSHLDAKMWVPFQDASGIIGSLWMSNIIYTSIASDSDSPLKLYLREYHGNTV